MRCHFRGIFPGSNSWKVSVYLDDPMSQKWLVEISAELEYETKCLREFYEKNSMLYHSKRPNRSHNNGGESFFEISKSYRISFHLWLYSRYTMCNRCVALVLSIFFSGWVGMIAVLL